MEKPDPKTIRTSSAKLSAAKAEVAASQKKSKLWLDENREALECYNEWVKENGVLLEEYCQF